MIRIFADYDRLSLAAADLFANRARRAVAERGRFCVALAGGGTPRRCYQLLANPPLRNEVPWSKVHVFWGDERCVPADDPRSNARMARQTLLDLVPLPPEQIHPMVCDGDPQGYAPVYEQLLRDLFTPDGSRFDLVLLGLGEDGHTASLIPGTPAPQERKRLVVPLRAPGDDFCRLSLTVPVLNRARQLVFLVSGLDKSRILQQVLYGPPRRFPAQFIDPEDGELLWLIDRAAAGPDAGERH